MACYSGGTETFNLDLEDWHPVESIYDSLTGMSPLMQLCRMVNLARLEFGVNAINFTRVGANPDDQQFAVVDYELHEDWNPLSDYDTILNQCAIYTKQLLDSSVVGTDCIARHFTNRTSLLSSLGSLSVTVLGSLLREDFLAKLLHVRQYLEALDGQQLTLTAWATVNVTFQPFNPGFIAGIFATGRDSSGDIEHDPPVSVGGGRCKYTTVLIDPPYQILENVSFESDQVGYGAPTINDEQYVGLTSSWLWSEDEVLPETEELTYEANCGIDPELLLNRFNYPVWTKTKRITKRQYFKVSSNMPVGQAFNWSAAIVQVTPSVPLASAHFLGPSSGTITVTSSNRSDLIAGDYYKDIVIELIEDDLDLSIQFKEAALGLDDSQAVYIASAIRTVVFDEHRTLCLDACGNYHLEG